MIDQDPEAFAVVRTVVAPPERSVRTMFAEANPVPASCAPGRMPALVVIAGAARTEKAPDVTSGSEAFVRSRTVRRWFAPLDTATEHDHEPSAAATGVQREEAGCAGSSTRNFAPGLAAPVALVLFESEFATEIVGATGGVDGGGVAEAPADRDGLGGVAGAA